MPELALCLSHLPLLLILCFVSFRFVGAYEIDRLRRFREDLIAVVKGTLLLRSDDGHDFLLARSLRVCVRDAAVLSAEPRRCALTPVLHVERNSPPAPQWL